MQVELPCDDGRITSGRKEPATEGRAKEIAFTHSAATTFDPPLSPFACLVMKKFVCGLAFHESRSEGTQTSLCGIFPHNRLPPVLSHFAVALRQRHCPRSPLAVGCFSERALSASSSFFFFLRVVVCCWLSKRLTNAKKRCL